MIQKQNYISLEKRKEFDTPKQTNHPKTNQATFGFGFCHIRQNYQNDRAGQGRVPLPFGIHVSEPAGHGTELRHGIMEQLPKTETAKWLSPAPERCRRYIGRGNDLFGSKFEPARY